MRTVAILIFVLFFSTSVFAEDLTCQYKETVVDAEETNMLPFDEEGNQLSDIEIQLPGEYGRPLKAINPNSVDVSIELDIEIQAKWSKKPEPRSLYCDVREVKRLSFTIPAEDMVEQSSPHFGNKVYCDHFMFLDDPTINYIETDLVDVKPTKVTINKTVCLGKDDGESCSVDSECGSTICNIAGICGTEKIVPCPDGQINCKDQLCSEPSIRGAGEAYLCEFQCKSGQGTDGICKYGLSTYLIFGLLFLFIVSVSWFFYWKGKRENLEDIKSKNATKEKIEKATSELERAQNDYEKARLKAYTNKQGTYVHLNKNGYEVYERTGGLFHKYWFEKNVLSGNYVKRGYCIHHIDGKKTNNDIPNLIEIPEKIHDKIDHKKIHDRESGIEELKRLGIKDERIKELKP